MNKARYGYRSGLYFFWPITCLSGFRTSLKLLQWFHLFPARSYYTVPFMYKVVSSKPISKWYPTGIFQKL